jgi:iron-sulfur cluster assembly protein
MITLTEAAAIKVKQQLDRRGNGLGIRVGIKTTGCSGLAYVIEYVDIPSPEDLSFVTHNVHVFVDPKSLAYLDGSEMDWVRNGLNEGFEFKNPNSKDECGCGESFRV